MTETDDALALARAFIDAGNRGDRAGAKALLAENVMQTLPLENEVRTGPEAAVENLWEYRNTFPDLRMDVTDGFGTGDRAAVQFTATGTYEPYTYGPNAKQITWRGCTIVRAQAGKITEIDVYVDWLGPIEQLGAIVYPPPARHEGTQTGPS